MYNFEGQASLWNRSLIHPQNDINTLPAVTMNTCLFQNTPPHTHTHTQNLTHRVSQQQHYWCLRLDTFLSWGVVVRIAGSVAAFLNSAHEMPVAPSPGCDKCLQTFQNVPWKANLPLVENWDEGMRKNRLWKQGDCPQKHPLVAQFTSLN